MQVLRLVLLLGFGRWFCALVPSIGSICWFCVLVLLVGIVCWFLVLCISESSTGMGGTGGSPSDLDWVGRARRQP